MKKSLLLILSLYFAFTAKAQQNTFSKALFPFGAQGDLNAYGLIETQDHGFIIAGNSSGWFSGNTGNCHLTKVDSIGDYVWNKGFSFTGASFFNLEFNQIIRSKDSNYIVVGKLDTAALCIKVNSFGDTIWSKTISSVLSDVSANYVQQTNDLGYIIVGQSSATNSFGNNHLFLAKLGATGNLLWSKVFVDTNDVIGYSVKQTPDSGFAIACVKRQNNPYSTNSIIMKTDKNGTTVWCKEFLNTNNVPNDIEVTNDGIVLITIRNQNPLLLKTDFSGNLLWAKDYTVGPSYYVGVSRLRLIKTHNNGFIFTIGIGDPSYLIKTDAFGNTIWGKNIEKPVSDVIEANDKGILAISNGSLGIEPIQKSTNYYSYGNNFGIIKMDSLGYTPLCTSNYPFSDINTLVSTSNYNLTSTPFGSIKNTYPSLNATTFTLYNGCALIGGSVTKNKLGNTITISPNPSYGQFKIIFNEYQSAELNIYNTFGEKIMQEIINKKQTDIELNEPANGIYYYNIEFSDHSTFSGKLIINH
jgi:Secretion system C-terminal sorting domain